VEGRGAPISNNEKKFINLEEEVVNLVEDVVKEERNSIESNDNNKFKECKESFERLKRIIETLNSKGYIKELQVEYEDGKYSKRVTSLEELEKKLFYALNEKKPFAIHWSTAIINKETGEKINEIVIDLDEDSEETNRKLLIDILKKIKDLGISKEKYFVKTSGNKGYHIFISPFIKEEQKQELLSYLETLNKAGYQIDMTKINSSSHMIRAPFSINFKSNRFSEVIDVIFKRTKVEIKELDHKEQLRKVLVYYSNFTEISKEEESKDLDEIIITEDIEKAVSYINRRVAEEVLGKSYEEVDYLLYKISKDLSKEVALDLDLDLKGKMLVKVIKEEVTTTNNIVEGVTYYLLLFLNKVLTIKKISVKLRKRKDEIFIQTKTKEEILKLDKIDSFGLYNDNGERRLFIKYENGIVQEIKLESKPEIKEILIKWLKENNLLIDLIFKYGFIWTSNKNVVLNVYDDYYQMKVDEYGKNNSLIERIGSYNPNKKLSPYFLSINIIKQAENSFYRFDFFDHLIDGIYKNNIVKIVVGYAFATLIKDIIKNNDILPIIPNLYLYSSVPNTGKTTLLLALTKIVLLKDFESGITPTQVRNLMSLRNNVVAIDDIQNLGNNDTKKIVTSWLKATSSRDIVITLGTGEQFIVSTPIAATSNKHPREIFDADEALLQRLILININKVIISNKWLNDLYRVMPDIKSKINNQLALGIYVVKKLRELAKERDLVIELLTLKEKIKRIIIDLTENNKDIKTKYENGYKFRDERFLSFVSFVYFGLWLFSNIYKDFLRNLNERELIKELALTMIENNEVYRGESSLSQVVPLLIETHNLRLMESDNPIIKNMHIFKSVIKKNPDIPVIFKMKDFYFFLKSKNIIEEFTREAKTIFGSHYSFTKVMYDLRNAGFDPSYQLMIARRDIYFENKKVKLKNIDEYVKLRVIKAHSYLVEPFLRQLRSYIVFDLDKNDYQIVGENSEEVVENEEN